MPGEKEFLVSFVTGSCYRWYIRNSDSSDAKYPKGIKRNPYFCGVQIRFEHLGNMPYGEAWEYQESLLQANLDIKKRNRERELGQRADAPEETSQHLLFVEHAPVFTLGKSGHLENLLVNNSYLQEKGIAFYKTNRGGDITYHGPGQLVGYPILDLEKLKPDIVLYMRNLEEVIIRVLNDYGLDAQRSPGETGVWLDPDKPMFARKLCAMGVRTSRWVTMHGFALNVNTDLSYFQLIVPCGIQNKQVSSLAKELGRTVDMLEVEAKTKKYFQQVFGVELETPSL
ncbi:MAG: lipoyl(octanoyl) transferase LipB [Chitinophagaceae bacterium]|nr:lipoyl(octanoyl) transferase LipB [Chitinophagaceae bacterium]